MEHTHDILTLPACVMRLLPSAQTSQKCEWPTQDVTVFTLKSMTLLLPYIASKISWFRARMDIYPKVCQPPEFCLHRFMYSVFLTQSEVWFILLGWLCSSSRERSVSVCCVRVIPDMASLTKVSSSSHRTFWRSPMSFVGKTRFLKILRISQILYSVHWCPMFLHFKAFVSGSKSKTIGRGLTT